jgi:hypothetical protein
VPDKNNAAVPAAPAGFFAAPRDLFGFAAWLGPSEGRVTTTWTPGAGILIHLEDPEDLSFAEAERLLAQLSNVLEQLKDQG